jgi:hypothetical protein
MITIADLDNAILLGKNRWINFQKEFGEKFFAPYTKTTQQIQVDSIDPNAKAALETLSPTIKRLSQQRGAENGKSRPKRGVETTSHPNQ